MSIQSQIEADLKSALLAGDKTIVETLRTVKSALQNEAISSGSQDSGLSDEAAQKILAHEAKKRTEAAEIYQKAGAGDRAQAELAEKAIIEKFLPAQMDEAAIEEIVRQEIAKLPAPTMADMGKTIGAVKAQTGAQADGAVIARLVKQALEQK